jgi:hypothetical protein
VLRCISLAPQHPEGGAGATMVHVRALCLRASIQVQLGVRQAGHCTFSLSMPWACVRTLTRMRGSVLPWWCTTSMLVSTPNTFLKAAANASLCSLLAFSPTLWIRVPSTSARAQQQEGRPRLRWPRAINPGGLTLEHVQQSLSPHLSLPIPTSLISQGRAERARHSPKLINVVMRARGCD